jgi:8-oxo-dGTP pyrophosphatase MutT (NUDIX family)
MDLTIKFEDEGEILNIRVVIIMETNIGFVLGQGNNKNYYHVIGGRCKLGETSIQSAARETEEETGLKLNEGDFKLISIIENFWESDHKKVNDKNWKVHEINYVFTVPKQEKIVGGIDSSGVVEIPMEQIAELDIRPNIIKKLILENKFETFTHHIVNA